MLGSGTQDVYHDAVRRLAGHYRRSPDQLSEQQLRDCFSYLVEEKRVPSSTLRTEIFCGKFSFDKTLGRPWPTLKFLRARPSYKLPVIFGREEGVSHHPVLHVRMSCLHICRLKTCTACSNCVMRPSEIIPQNRSRQKQRCLSRAKDIVEKSGVLEVLWLSCLQLPDDLLAIHRLRISDRRPALPEIDCRALECRCRGQADSGLLSLALSQGKTS